MRKIVVREFGGPEVLRSEEHPTPVCPPRGYLVRVHAIGLNYAEVVERRGRYRKDQSLPCEPGKEASGVIVAVGPQATEFDLGDRVIVARFDNGCYAEVVPAEPSQLMRGPDGYTFEELAAFGHNYTTAWWAMTRLARARAGESALILAAAGGVGTAALALGRALGLHPLLGAAGGAEKCRLAELLGATRCLDYSQDDLASAVLDATAGRGVDFCLESVGGSMFETSVGLLGPLGRMVVVGWSSIEDNYAQAISRVHPLKLQHRSISVGGLNIDRLRVYEDRAGIRELVQFCNAHRLRPLVGQTFSFDDIAAAHQCLESRRSTGKVVVTI